MGYYEQVEAIVKPHMKTFQNDLKYDKEALKNYTGEFIHASRVSGTNMILLDRRAFSVEPVENQQKLFEKQIERHNVFMFEANNSHFLHGKNGKVKEVSKEEAQQIFHDFVETKLARKKANVLGIKPQMIASDLKFYIQDKGRTWKSALKSAWFDNSSSLPASLQRLRNYFDHDAVFKRIKPDMSSDEMYATLCDIWNESDLKKMREPEEAADAIAKMVNKPNLATTQAQDL